MFASTAIAMVAEVIDVAALMPKKLARFWVRTILRFSMSQRPGSWTTVCIVS